MDPVKVNPTSANFPMTPEGRTYHVGAKEGEVANRILLVGPTDRAERVSTWLDKIEHTVRSSRDFVVITGMKGNKRVSVVKVGMGYPMMDFAVREICAVTKGPLAMIRFGSCGTPHPDVSIGTVVVAKKSYFIQENPDGFVDSRLPPYSVAKEPRYPDLQLHELLIDKLNGVAQRAFTLEARPDMTADTFYSSQGRTGSHFVDLNKKVMDLLSEKDPEIGSLQMETFRLFALAKRACGTFKAAACSLVLANRTADNFLDAQAQAKIEKEVGEACLEALVDIDLEDKRE